MENKFCPFITKTMGFCGTYTGGGRCKKHLGVKEVRKVKAKKFRGDSRWAQGEGHFEGKESS